MLIPRKSQERGGQVLVSLPAAVRHHLAVYGVAQIYWHVRVKGEVTLTTTPTRRGGQRAGTAGCPGCADRDEEIRKLTARLGTASAMTAGHAFNQGYEQALKHVMPLRAFLDGLRGDVSRVLAHVGGPRRAPRRRVETVAAPVLDAAPVSEEKKEGAGGLVPDPLAARAGPEGSDSPPRAEE